jgi:acyl-CoA thioesterase I
VQFNQCQVSKPAGHERFILLLMPPELIQALMQFRHPKKIVPPIPGGMLLPDSAVAALIGVNLETYQAAIAEFESNVQKAASQLLQNPEFAQAVDALPFKSGNTIVGLGDSITDDSQSWLEILGALLEQRRPEDTFKIINAGISGDTTVHILSRFADVLRLEPDYIITLIGTNDARSHGNHTTTALVPDTARNLEILRTWMIAKSKATRIWLTPPSVIEEKIAAFIWFSSAETMWYNKNLEPIAQAIRNIPDLIVDTRAALGQNPDFLLEDGLHPNLAGQIEIVKTVVYQLSHRASERMNHYH